MTLKKSWMRNYIIVTFLLCPPLQGMASPDDTKGETVVIGTVVNQLPHCHRAFNSVRTACR